MAITFKVVCEEFRGEYRIKLFFEHKGIHSIEFSTEGLDLYKFGFTKRYKIIGGSMIIKEDVIERLKKAVNRYIKKHGTEKGYIKLNGYKDYSEIFRRCVLW